MQNLDFLQLSFIGILKNIYFKIGEMLSVVNSSHSIVAILGLLAFSFLYGLLHAAGPGHGKALIASYFGANNKSYSKAIIIAILIAIVHVFSAFFITMLGYYILSDILTLTVYNTNKTIMAISAIIIVAIGLNMLKNKIKHYKNTSPIKWQTAISSCQCSSCKVNNKEDVWIILAAGIIPCPGTITIFLLAITNGVYFYAFLSAIMMSIGMSIVMIVSAFLSIKIRDKIKSKHNMKLKYLDLFATSVIIFLGISLLLASFS